MSRITFKIDISNPYFIASNALLAALFGYMSYSIDKYPPYDDSSDQVYYSGDCQNEDSKCCSQKNEVQSVYMFALIFTGLAIFFGMSSLLGILANTTTFFSNIPIKEYEYVMIMLLGITFITTVAAIVILSNLQCFNINSYMWSLFLICAICLSMLLPKEEIF